MSQIHLIVGPVGAGKSTFARKLAAEHTALHINLDDWMTRLFRPDRPNEGVLSWYTERVERCKEQILNLTESLLALDVKIVLELGLIRRDERYRFYERIEPSSPALHIYVLDAHRDERRRRVMQRNTEQGATFVMPVPLPFFELASDMWQEVDDEEADGRDVRFIFTDA